MALITHLMRKLHQGHPGSLLIDALLAVTIFGIIVTAFSTGILQGRLGTVWASDRIRAIYLAQEGLNAVRFVRGEENEEGKNIGYDTLFAYETGVDHGVHIVNGSWELLANTPTSIDNFFTRSIRFMPGNNDNELIVQSTVNWESGGFVGIRSITFTSLLSNWAEDPPPPPPDWSQPLVKGSLTDALFDARSLNKLAVSGSYAFIAASLGASNSYGLFVVDISNLENPALVNSVDVSSADAYDVALRGHYAYLSTNDANGEIKIIDITDPLTADCAPCAGEIDLASNGITNGIALTGTGLYITREQDVSADELSIYDIGDNPTDPPLIVSYDTDPSSDSLYAVATAGSNPGAYYAYVASGTNNDQELRVVNTTGGVLTGNGSAGSNARGTAVAIYGTGAYVAAYGNDSCELFSFDITGKLHNPNAAPSCGGNQSYDLGGINDPNDIIYDMEAWYGNSMEFPHLFMGLDAKKLGNSYRHLQIINIGDVRNINSASKRIYDEDIANDYGVGNGLTYRLSDHTLFMVGGDIGATSHFLILWPTYP